MDEIRLQLIKDSTSDVFKLWKLQIPAGEVVQSGRHCGHLNRVLNGAISALIERNAVSG